MFHPSELPSTPLNPIHPSQHHQSSPPNPKPTPTTDSGVFVKPPFPIFLRIPVELRLIIYRLLSAFTLLQLCNTHPRFQSEITSSPRIFTKAFGYTPPKATIPRKLRPPLTLTLSRFSRLASRQELEVLKRIVPPFRKDDGRSPRSICPVSRYATWDWQLPLGLVVYVCCGDEIGSHMLVNVDRTGSGGSVLTENL
ncbi:hypothetical protein BJ508DRAFT_329324 [Ascobolus immersus RN42]|uniref:F-box domain-containing protein n=1 Tax=Ascobolus immersus RN42 TaxID=1160509 RepID=A0A3N4HWZ3_ASCIM|nr:hypothetical protein BJ508DRAFT_329324 [Ascobolus immersus RN42]